MLYTHLTREERHTIASLNKQGRGVRNIAQTINRSPSTISRELRRNASNDGRYDHAEAHDKRNSRLHGASPKYSSKVWERVEERILLDHSPEQITGALNEQGLEAPSHETIYLHIWKDKLSGGDLHTHLRHLSKSYRKRGAAREKRGQIKDARSIEERPSIVEERSRIGDWEIDTVIGKIGGSVLVTSVERKSRYTVIRKANSKEAFEVGFALFEGLRPYKDKVLTITADNGKEFAGHKLTANLFDCDYFFAHPYSSWERGLNENTNGLIRQYFPKKSSFDDLSDEDITRVQDLLNSRPRKCLDYKTPNDIFNLPTSVALAS